MDIKLLDLTETSAKSTTNPPNLTGTVECSEVYTSQKFEIKVLLQGQWLS